MLTMKERLKIDIEMERMGRYIVNSFEEARNNDRKKNIVLLDDGIYLTFKADTEENKDIFGELVSWVDDEFNEDEEVYYSAVNAIKELFSYSDDELNDKILNNDLVADLTFTPYEEQEIEKE